MNRIRQPSGKASAKVTLRDSTEHHPVLTDLLANDEHVDVF